MPHLWGCLTPGIGLCPGSQLLKIEFLPPFSLSCLSGLTGSKESLNLCLIYANVCAFLYKMEITTRDPNYSESGTLGVLQNLNQALPATSHESTENLTPEMPTLGSPFHFSPPWSCAISTPSRLRRCGQEGGYSDPAIELWPWGAQATAVGAEQGTAASLAVCDWPLPAASRPGKIWHIHKSALLEIQEEV